MTARARGKFLEVCGMAYHLNGDRDNHDHAHCRYSTSLKFANNRRRHLWSQYCLACPYRSLALASIASASATAAATTATAGSTIALVAFTYSTSFAFVTAALHTLCAWSTLLSSSSRNG